MKKALAYSASLHLVTAALLGGLRTSFPLTPNIVMVNWVDAVPVDASMAIGTPPVAKTNTKTPATETMMPDSLAEQARKIDDGSPNVTSSENVAPDSLSLTGANLQARQLSLEEAYVAAVRQELERHKSYPAVARRLGQTGRVVLRFKVGSDGAVLESALVSKSNFGSLNTSAEGILAALKKFQPIPAELKRLSWEFTVPIEYRLE